METLVQDLPGMPFDIAAFDPGHASCISALALVRDAVRLPRAAELDTLEHRLLRDMHMQLGVAG
eukprot:9594134-Heterocapsa_arctica.AAC.1